MDSASLQDRGIGAWVAFACTTELEVLAALPPSPGVYVILLGAPEQRRRGASDIAYIGKATNQNGLRGRVLQYFHPGPTQSTNIAMNQRLFAAGCALRVGFIVGDSVSVATRLESDLLLKFEDEHLELPPYNRQRALDLMSRLGSTEGTIVSGTPMSERQDEALSKLAEIEAHLARSPIGRGLLDGGLSLIPGLGAAMSSVLATRPANLAERNTANLILELRAGIAKVGDEKLDAAFLASDDFVSTLLRTLELNARASRGEKVRLFAKVFLGFLRGSGADLPFKGIFLRIIDELEPEHIAVLHIIYRESATMSTSRDPAGRAWVERIAEELGIAKGRALAFGVQLMQFGLVQDDSIGRYGYTPGRFKITDYGCEFCEHLGASEVDDANQEAG